MMVDKLDRHSNKIKVMYLPNLQTSCGTQSFSRSLEENVLTQVENLISYPAVRSKLRAQKISIHVWIYEIETGKIFAFNANEGKFVEISADAFPLPNPLVQSRVTKG